MNYGNIEKNTAAGRLFAYLLERRDEWVSGWTLTIETKTTAVSTRISEVRAQIGRLGFAVETKRVKDAVTLKPAFYYRVVTKEVASVVTD